MFRRGVLLSGLVFGAAFAVVVFIFFAVIGEIGFAVTMAALAFVVTGGLWVVVFGYFTGAALKELRAERFFRHPKAPGGARADALAGLKRLGAEILREGGDNGLIVAKVPGEGPKLASRVSLRFAAANDGATTLTLGYEPLNPLGPVTIPIRDATIARIAKELGAH